MKWESNPLDFATKIKGNVSKTHNSSGILIVVQAIISDSVAINVADGFNVRRASMWSVEIMKSGTDERIGCWEIVMLNWNSCSHIGERRRNTNWRAKTIESKDDCLRQKREEEEKKTWIEVKLEEKKKRRKKREFQNEKKCNEFNGYERTYPRLRPELSFRGDWMSWHYFET